MTRRPILGGYGKLGGINPRQARARSRAMRRIDQQTLMELITEKREQTITGIWFELRRWGYSPADIVLAVAWVGWPDTVHGFLELNEQRPAMTGAIASR
jgi:hypothetical protein